jgi:hypothetical protein
MLKMFLHQKYNLDASPDDILILIDFSDNIKANKKTGIKMSRTFIIHGNKNAYIVPDTARS